MENNDIESEAQTLSIDRLRRLREWFEAATALPEGERDDWLRSSITADADLAIVLRMLAEDGHSGFLDRTLSGRVGAFAPAEIAAGRLIGRRIGAFRVERELGRGGMAVVFLGRRIEGDFEQVVAIKLLRRGLYSPAEQHLFFRERRLLATLNHPDIARLIDGGVTEAGIPYLVMEFVDGVPITHFANEHWLDVRSRLRLVLRVCRAVEAAHRRLIVHRDIKPTNILVTTDGGVKLLDFGIAKMLEDEDGDATASAGIFTPAYAAPEQIDGGAITTATDVYALGVLLHEILLGKRPDGSGRRPSAVAALLFGLPASHPHAPKQLARLLRGDLDNIILKSLEADMERRYPSARALAEDIERHLGGRTVEAHPPSGWYVARKFVQRHRGGVVATAVFVAGMFGALAFSLWQAGVARREAQRAEQQARIAMAAQGFLADIFNASSGRQGDPAKARNTTARELLELGAKKIDGEMNDAPSAKLNMLMLLGQLHKHLALDEESAALYRKALNLAQQTYGQYAPAAFEAQINLAGELHSASSDEAAVQVLEEAQQLLDHNHDDDPGRRAQLYEHWALYYTVRDLPRALAYARKAADAYEKLPDSLQKAEFFSRKANVESNSWHDADAITSYEKAIEIALAVGGERNPDLVVYYAQLAEVQMRNREIAAAERNMRHALDLAKTINGDAHADVIQCETRLGRLLADSGRLPEGLALLDDAKRSALALLGLDEGFHVPQVLFQHGVLLMRSGRIEEALVDLEAAVANRRHHRPGTTPLALFLESAAAAQIEMGRFAEAGKNLDEAHTILEKVGQKSPSEGYDAYLVHRAHLALVQGRTREADAFLRDVSPIKAGSDGLDLQEVSSALTIAEIAQAAGRQVDAIALVTDLRRRIESSSLVSYYGYFVEQTHFVEGLARLRTGELRVARSLLEQTLAYRQKSLDPASVKIAEAQIALAESELGLGDIAKARVLMHAAMAIHATHTELGPQYRAPLQQLVASLPIAH